MTDQQEYDIFIANLEIKFEKLKKTIQNCLR